MNEPLPSRLSAFFWYWILKYRWGFLWLVFTALIYGVLLSAAPYLLKVIIDTVSLEGASIEKVVEQLWMPAFWYLVLVALTGANYRLMEWIDLRLYPPLRVEIVERMFGYLNRHSYRYFQDHFAGSLATKVGDLATSSSRVLMHMNDFAAHLVGVIVASCLMYTVHPVFCWILFVWSVLIIGVSFRLSKGIHKLSNEHAESVSVLRGKLVDSVTNMFSVFSFARNRYEDERISHALSGVKQKDVRAQVAMLWLRIILDVGFVILIACMLGGLIYYFRKNWVTAGDFVLILTISLSLAQSTRWIAHQFLQVTEELGKCTQALKIVSVPHEITDKPDAKPLKVSAGRIEFEDVAFNYNQGQNIFENKNVVIEEGQKVGLVGYSGGGKSTFVNLITRFFDVETGVIRIDGQAVSDVTMDSLRANISVIPQDVNLFHRSLMENIQYGNLNASDDEVKEAARLARCDEFINALPEGYDTLVGERGIKLSGGQRQRIAIARAILKDAPILILDEATSALDSVTEGCIQGSMQLLMEGKTTLVIAHRLSTLSEMDRLLVFSDGKIIEDGTHDELLKAGGHYAKLWSMQAGGFLPEQG